MYIFMNNPNDHNNDDDTNLRARLRELNTQIKRMRPANENRPINTPITKRAMHAGGHLLGGVVTGFVMGYTIDWWLHSKPWALLIGLFLGTVAGVSNMLRAFGFRIKG